LKAWLVLVLFAVGMAASLVAEETVATAHLLEVVVASYENFLLAVEWLQAVGLLVE